MKIHYIIYLNTKKYIINIYSFFAIKFIKFLTIFMFNKQHRRNFRNKYINLISQKKELLLKEIAFIFLKEDYPLTIKNTSNPIIFLTDSGAVAEYAVRTYSELDGKFDIYVYTTNKQNIENLKNKSVSNNQSILPIYDGNWIQDLPSETPKLFTIGDSCDYKNIYDLAKKTKGIPNRWFILPDARVFGAITKKMSQEDIKNLVKKYYSDIVNLNDTNVIDCIVDNKLVFLKHIVEETGISNIIVYGDKAKETILNDMQRNKLDINLKVVEQAYERINNKQKSNLVMKQNNEYLIGTFGIPDNVYKRTNIIIQAFDILMREHFPVKLLFVGPKIYEYIKKEKVVNSNIVIIENPDYDEWLRLMNTVDLAIQLRERAFAHTSGCLFELIGLEKRCIVTKGMISSSWHKLCCFVQEGISAELLAQNIKEKLLENNDIDTLSLPYSNNAYLHNAKQIYNIVNEKGEKNE